MSLTNSGSVASHAYQNVQPSSSTTSTVITTDGVDEEFFDIPLPEDNIYETIQPLSNLRRSIRLTRGKAPICFGFEDH